MFLCDWILLQSLTLFCFKDTNNGGKMGAVVHAITDDGVIIMQGLSNGNGPNHMTIHGWGEAVSRKGKPFSSSEIAYRGMMNLTDPDLIAELPRNRGYLIIENLLNYCCKSSGADVSFALKLRPDPTTDAPIKRKNKSKIPLCPVS